MPTIKCAAQIAAFLDLIAWSEGTSRSLLTNCDGYDEIVTGVDGHHVFTDFSVHPFARGRAPIVVTAAKPATYTHSNADDGGPGVLVKPATPALHSTASGRYQLILATWEDLAIRLHLGTFSPANQDLACVQLLHECHADDSLYCGMIEKAIDESCETWASFPGNLFHQGGHPLAQLMAQYTTLFNTATAAEKQGA